MPVKTFQSAPPLPNWCSLYSRVRSNGLELKIYYINARYCWFIFFVSFLFSCASIDIYWLLSRGLFSLGLFQRWPNDAHSSSPSPRPSVSPLPLPWFIPFLASGGDDLLKWHFLDSFFPSWCFFSSFLIHISFSFLFENLFFLRLNT